MSTTTWTEWDRADTAEDAWLAWGPWAPQPIISYYDAITKAHDGQLIELWAGDETAAALLAALARECTALKRLMSAHGPDWLASEQARRRRIYQHLGELPEWMTWPERQICTASVEALEYGHDMPALHAAAGVILMSGGTQRHRNAHARAALGRVGYCATVIAWRRAYMGYAAECDECAAEWDRDTE